MKDATFREAMALYADADQRATGALVEMVTATVLRKLNPPVHGADIVSISITPHDIEETVLTHVYQARYEGDKMELFLTPIGSPNVPSA